LCLAAALALLLRPPLASAAAPHSETLLRDDRKLRLFISREFAPEQRIQLTQWITFIADALAQVYGHWPRHHWEVSITPASAADHDLIPWGQVRRDEIDRVEFYTAPRATAQELKHEWTGYHELAHLLIPYQGWGDTWFSEGLASYYQNILQGRAGILTEQQTWQNLYDGFMRGRSESQFDGQSLASVSDAMRKSGGFMRVYWSGAWYFLAADLCLRQQSSGRFTLDDALQKLNGCCADERLSVREMVVRLDELNEVALFTRLYDQVRASQATPAFESMFASLGIAIVDGSVHLQDVGPGAQLRRQFTRPGPL
jgi:hypothetical protein